MISTSINKIYYNGSEYNKAYFNGVLYVFGSEIIKDSVISSGYWNNESLWNNNDLFKN